MHSRMDYLLLSDFLRATVKSYCQEIILFAYSEVSFMRERTNLQSTFFSKWQARRPGGADLFICYAGVQLRDGVAAKADWLVFDFKDLVDSS